MNQKKVVFGIKISHLSRVHMSSSSNQESTELHERVFEAEWDEEGVYFYQAYNDPIADWAIKNQRHEDIYRNILRT